MSFRQVLAAVVWAAAANGDNPPAADPSGAAFFLKVAEDREAPAGLAEASAAALDKAAGFLFTGAVIENSIRDENGGKVPPHIHHALIDDGDRFSYRVSYPVPAASPPYGPDGWSFNSRINVLVVAHGEPDVEVIL